jgi:hypothetical protein
MDRKTGIFIALPLVLIIVFVVAAYQIPLKGALSEFEIEMLTFTPSDLKVRIKQITHKIGDLDGYFDFESIVAGNATENEDDLVKENGYNDTGLSLIVISGKKKMAIMNGKLVKEGDSINGMKIARIEEKKILLKNKSSQWIYLKEAQ